MTETFLWVSVVCLALTAFVWWRIAVRWQRIARRWEASSERFEKLAYPPLTFVEKKVYLDGLIKRDVQ